MPDLRLDSALNFDRGIERIVHEQGPLTTLPDGTRLAPSEMPQQLELNQLLALPNLNDYLDGLLVPGVQNQELLEPARFRQTLDGTQRMLREAANENPEAARVLNRAARQLAEEADLRDLLQMYRSMLLQG